MAKVVYVKLKNARSGKKPDSVMTKRVKSEKGKTTTLYTVDADSPSFSDDLSYAFEQNVRRVRREQQKRSNEARRLRKSG